MLGLGLNEMDAEMSPEKEKVNSSSMAVNSQGIDQLYPKPLAKYQDVVGNPKLFMDTLEKLHEAMGTKFMIPTIGGRELDLHQLFVEVTSRGGIEKVLDQRRWREVTQGFNFPSTATNASFVLRKYYMSLIYHYEQVYFFQSTGWSSTLNASQSAASVASISSRRSSGSAIASTDDQLPAQKRKKTSNDYSPSGMPLEKDAHVVGIIDGKCEHGYFVTVNIGTTKLQGILYHPTGQNKVLASQIPGIASITSKVGRRRRRRKKLSKRDPTHPKPNRSGYNFFFAEQHARLKPLHPGKDRGISKLIGELWNNLSETEKAVYQERGVKDKERYRSEMEAYRQRLKADEVISTAVPLQQRPPEPESLMRELHLKMDMDEDYLDESTTASSNSEDKNFDTDSEMESHDRAEVAPGSTNHIAEPAYDGDAFELRRRDDDIEKKDHDLTSSSENVEAKKDGSLT